MPAKTHRAGAPLRSHSRSSSSSKLGLNNLQFTQKDAIISKHPEKAKKNGQVHHDPHARTTSPFPRNNSGIRTHAKEPQPHAVVPRRPQTPNTRPNGAKHKAGFTIASPGEDEDEWVSSESGAATPNELASDSDVEEEATTPVEQSQVPFATQIDKKDPAPEANLPRIATARPSNHTTAAGFAPTSVTPPAMPVPTAAPIASDLIVPRPPKQRIDTDVKGPKPEVVSQNGPNFRPTSKRYSITRPPSTHSITSRYDVPLRPHPLIRGHSYGQSAYPKPGPLAPLTVTSETSPAELSPSPPLSAHDGPRDKLSTSPSSMRTIGSPSSLDPSSSQMRRTSVSSARSVATLPVPATLRDKAWTGHDRTRTMSTTSSSSAALSLTHLPSTQMVSFFPPPNPHVNLEAIHPLLPAPYLTSHLTILARRTLIRESFDRVMRAKHAK